MIPQLADPSGPPDTRPPTQPPPPPPPPRALAADALAVIDGLLVAALAHADAELPPTEDRIEICGQEILAFRLRMARRAVEDLRRYTQTPVRSSLVSAVAVAGGPVDSRRGRAVRAVSQLGGARAGEPPLPGAGTFSLPPVPTVPSFDNGPRFAAGSALIGAFERRAD